MIKKGTIVKIKFSGVLGTVEGYENGLYIIREFNKMLNKHESYSSNALEIIKEPPS